MAKRKRFLAGFNPRLVLIKANGLFVAAFTFLTLFAEWSDWVGAVRDDVSARPYAIFVIWLAWNALSVMHELIRAFLRYDLERVREENRLQRQRRPRKR